MIFGLLGNIFGLLGKIFGLLGTQQTENIYPTDRKKLPNRPKKYLLKIFGLLGKIFGLMGFGLMGFGLVGRTRKIFSKSIKVTIPSQHRIVIAFTCF